MFGWGGRRRKKRKKENDTQKTTKIPRNQETPMTLTIMRPARGKNKSMTPYGGFFLLKEVVMAIERT